MKTNISAYTILVLFTLLCLTSSCKEMVLGDEPDNNPESNFDLFWNDLDAHYGLFTVKSTNWDSLYQVYRPLVTSQTTNDELFDILSEMIEPLNDSHTSITNTLNQDTYTSGATLNTKAVSEFSRKLIESKYVSNFQRIGNSPIGIGSINNQDIGYIYINKMEGDASIIDKVVAKLKNHKAIIIDLRINSGGSDLYSERVAGAFADGEHFIYTVQTRNGKNHSDFTDKKEYYTSKAGAEQYLKPVVILTSRFTISAAEIFMLHMKSFSHITQIGDTTAGDFSDISNTRFLPNGMAYSYSIQKYLMPDGKSKDGIGHIPDVYIKNSKADIDAGNDWVLERAVESINER